MPSTPSTPVSLNPVLSLVIAVALGALWGAVSALVPFVKINALFLLLTLLAALLVFVRATGPAWVTLPLALLAGLGASAAMWVTWFGLTQGWTWTQQLAQMGPQAFARAIEQIVRRTSYSVGGAPAVGPDTLRLMWQAQTWAFIALPPLGALITALRRARTPVR